MPRIHVIAVAAVALVAVLGGVYLIATQGPQDRFAGCRSGAATAGRDQIGGHFTLVDESGRTVTSDAVLDQPALIYFGYTFCPDICPLDVARNAEAVEILEERGKIVKPIFITVDPQRDTPAVLAAYTDAMHPRMLGLTGTPAQVRAASRAYRTFYQAHDPEPGDDGYYTVDHTTLTYLSLPDDGFVAFFRRDLSGQALADNVQCFLDAG